MFVFGAKSKLGQVGGVLSYKLYIHKQYGFNAKIHITAN